MTFSFCFSPCSFRRSAVRTVAGWGWSAHIRILATAATMAKFTITRLVATSALAFVQNFNLRQLKKKREKDVSCGEENNHSTVLNESWLSHEKEQDKEPSSKISTDLYWNKKKIELKTNRQPVGTNTSSLKHPQVCFDCCCNDALFTVRCFLSNHWMQETQIIKKEIKIFFL